MMASVWRPRGCLIRRAESTRAHEEGEKHGPCAPSAVAGNARNDGVGVRVPRDGPWGRGRYVTVTERVMAATSPRHGGSAPARSQARAATRAAKAAASRMEETALSAARVAPDAAYQQRKPAQNASPAPT